jgi:hypothetical protein
MKNELRIHNQGGIPLDRRDSHPASGVLGLVVTDNRLIFHLLVAAYCSQLTQEVANLQQTSASEYYRVQLNTRVVG